MITTRQMHVEVELLRWILLVIAALALVLATATLAGADPMLEPKLLPGDMDKVARPMPVEPAREFFPEGPLAREFPPAEAAARLWTILEHHRAGRVFEALSGWEQLLLQNGMAHWREIAMGAARLQAGELEHALLHLEAARQKAPENPVVAYYMGLLRLEQAAAAARVPDRMHPGTMRWAVLMPQEDKAAVFEMLALAEFRKATAQREKVQLNNPLLATDAAIDEEIIVPRVGDLLAALGADNFVGKAHCVLFDLHLGRGELIEAEMNIDMAAATGQSTLHDYRDLAEAYLARDKDADSLRVVKKDLQKNYPWVGLACEKLMQNALDRSRPWVW